jgi:hypothetical protein
MPRNARRLTVVIAATLVVVGYCLGLLAHVRSSADIGVYSTFSLKVARIYPQYVDGVEGGSSSKIIGATIRQVGPYPVQDWPAYIRALHVLQDRSATDDTSGTFKHQGNKDWVRVVCQRSPEEAPFAFWCVLGRTPLESTLPALLWLMLEVGLFAVGALVFWKRPSDRYAGPFFALTIVAVGAYLGGYHWWQIVTQPILMVMFVASAMLLAPVTLHYYHVFPRPKSWLERHPRWTLLAIYGPPILSGIAVVAGYFWVRSLFRSGVAAEQVREALYWHRRILYVAFSVSAAYVTAGIGTAVRRIAFCPYLKRGM